MRDTSCARVPATNLDCLVFTRSRYGTPHRSTGRIDSKDRDPIPHTWTDNAAYARGDTMFSSLEPSPGERSTIHRRERLVGQSDVPPPLPWTFRIRRPSHVESKLSLSTARTPRYPGLRAEVAMLSPSTSWDRWRPDAVVTPYRRDVMDAGDIQSDLPRRIRLFVVLVPRPATTYFGLPGPPWRHSYFPGDCLDARSFASRRPTTWEEYLSGVDD